MSFISVTEALSPFADYGMLHPDRLHHASERGKAVHAAIATHLKGLWVTPLPKDAQGFFDSFRHWADNYLDSVVFVEHELKNEPMGLIGHIDLIGTMRHAKTLSVIDFKTPLAHKAVWDAQVAAYVHLAKHKRIDTNQGFALRLNADGKPAIADHVMSISRHYAIFLAAFTAYRNLKAGA